MKTFDTFEAIVEFGILKEEQANKFYLAMAERVADRQIAALFAALAEEELEHKAKLELELMKMGRTVDISEGVAEFNDSDYIYSDSPELDMDYADVLQLAIAKEDAAFRIYFDMAAMAKSKEAREMLVEMAQEEVKHKFRFEIEFDRLTESK
ncbi:MAG: hypothetical protein JW720_13775 [Sedimentisphaerales bacterium]|nr:hypothetical protein [Sedimentisphaerales bacterium]